MSWAIPITLKELNTMRNSMKLVTAIQFVAAEVQEAILIILFEPKVLKREVEYN